MPFDIRLECCNTAWQTNEQITCACAWLQRSNLHWHNAFCWSPCTPSLGNTALRWKVTLMRGTILSRQSMTVKQKSQFGDKLCNYGITTSLQFLSYFVSKRVTITIVTGVFQIEFCLFEIFSFSIKLTKAFRLLKSKRWIIRKFYLSNKHWYTIEVTDVTSSSLN